MMSKGSKLSTASVKVDMKHVQEMFSHFKAQMGTISLDVADLSLDLRALSNSLAHWQAQYGALQASQVRPSKKRPRTASTRTSTRRKV
jgi:malate synthase